MKYPCSSHELHYLKEIDHIQEREFGTQNDLEKLMIYDMKNA